MTDPKGNCAEKKLKSLPPTAAMPAMRREISPLDTVIKPMNKPFWKPHLKNLLVTKEDRSFPKTATVNTIKTDSKEKEGIQHLFQQRDQLVADR